MLDPLIFDRFTMGFALAVHIILAVIGMILPLIILISEYIGNKYNDNDYKVLARRLTKAFVIFFAVGTASGMLVAVSLVFIWPTFMALVSQVAILTVYVEVFAFFMESIFLALYIYSAEVLTNKYVRVGIMFIVACGAAASAALITLLNAWMNTPAGFNIQTYLLNGTVTGINPLAVFSSPSAGIEVPHVLATSYFAGAAILLAYFAYMLLKSKSAKEKRYYVKASKVVFGVLLIATIFAIITGILSIEALYHLQPEKFAAIELDINSTAYAPELIGGLYINGAVKYALPIPDLQSVLATGNASGVVPGLNQFPQNTWPPLFIHDLFDIMVVAAFGIGFLLIVIFALHLAKRKVFLDRRILWLFVLIGALALVLLENGWMVDEIGRTPWIIYNVMTIQQASNTSPTIIPLAILVVALYAAVLPLTFLVLRRIFRNDKLRDELK